MMLRRRSGVLAVLILASAVSRGLAQDAGTAPPVLTPQEMEDFLLHAPITTNKGLLDGVTDARRVTLSDGRTTHDAQIQHVDMYRPFFEVAGHTEVNFRDSYRYNIAAYRLSVLLGLDIVPMSVRRVVDGKPAAVTWWIDDVVMDEGQRQKKKVASPDPVQTNSYLYILRVFDELIQNRDRNAGNLLWTRDWTMWMIDHTRAFRLGKEPLRPERLDKCERSLLAHLRALTPDTVREAMGDALLEVELDALLARRDAIVALFDKRIAERGESAVLYTLPR